jgi:putative membrane protein
LGQSTRSFTDKLFLIFKGIAMGTANKVPGISGGLVAYVGGFYEEFIYSLQKLNFKAFKLVISGRFGSFYEYINGKFLSLLILGEAISYFTVSKGFDLLIQYYPVLVWATFFGMILGSIYYISKSYGEWTRRNALILILGIAIGIGISLLDPAQQNTNLFFVFFCGMISISGMTLPGLSGSFILILLGNYVLLLVDSINAFFDTMVAVVQGDFSWWNDPVHMEMLSILTAFLLGSIVGLISLSHLLGWTIKHYRNETNAMIIGFITGSLGVVWPWKKEVFQLTENGLLALDKNGNKILENYSRYWPEINNTDTWIALLMVVIGFLSVYILYRYGNKANPF